MADLSLKVSTESVSAENDNFWFWA